MKLIKDERLQLQNLKNIQIAFVVQSVAILTILLYEIITDGVMEATSNPLWMVFLLTIVVLGWLNLRVSVDVYDSTREQKKPGPYYLIVLLSAIVGFIMALFAKFGPDSSSNSGAFLVGSVVFVCFLIPFSIVHYIIKKRSEEDDI